MCGRIFTSLRVDRLKEIARTTNVKNVENWEENYNLPPTKFLPTVRIVDRGRELTFLKWGHKIRSRSVINARAEEVKTKPSFTDLVKTNRCVIIVEGYYEWTITKTPYCFHDTEKDYILLAGIYFSNDEVVILTRYTKDKFAAVSERMPLLLTDALMDIWLDCEKYPFEDIMDSKILSDENDVWKKVAFYRLSTAVNNTRNNGKRLITPVGGPLRPLRVEEKDWTKTPEKKPKTETVLTTSLPTPVTSAEKSKVSPVDLEDLKAAAGEKKKATKKIMFTIPFYLSKAKLGKDTAKKVVDKQKRGEFYGLSKPVNE